MSGLVVDRVAAPCVPVAARGPRSSGLIGARLARGARCKRLPASCPLQVMSNKQNRSITLVIVGFVLLLGMYWYFTQ